MNNLTPEEFAMIADTAHHALPAYLDRYGIKDPAERQAALESMTDLSSGIASGKYQIVGGGIIGPENNSTPNQLAATAILGMYGAYLRDKIRRNVKSTVQLSADTSKSTSVNNNSGSIPEKENVIKQNPSDVADTGKENVIKQNPSDVADTGKENVIKQNPSDVINSSENSDEVNIDDIIIKAYQTPENLEESTNLYSISGDLVNNGFTQDDAKSAYESLARNYLKDVGIDTKDLPIDDLSQQFTQRLIDNFNAFNQKRIAGKTPLSTDFSGYDLPLHWYNAELGHDDYSTWDENHNDLSLEHWLPRGYWDIISQQNNLMPDETEGGYARSRDSYAGQLGGALLYSSASPVTSDESIRLPFGGIDLKNGVVSFLGVNGGSQQLQIKRVPIATILKNWEQLGLTESAAARIRQQFIDYLAQQSPVQENVEKVKNGTKIIKAQSGLSTDDIEKLSQFKTNTDIPTVPIVTPLNENTISPEQLSDNVYETSRHKSAQSSELQNMSAYDMARVAALGTDIASIFAGSTPLTGGLMGLGSTAVRGVADVLDNNVSAKDATTTAITGIGSSLLGMLPGVGSATGVARVLRGVKSLMPILMTGATMYDVATNSDEYTSMLKKITSGNIKHLNTEDLQRLGNLTMLIAGTAKGKLSTKSQKKFEAKEARVDIKGTTATGEVNTQLTVKEANDIAKTARGLRTKQSENKALEKLNSIQKAKGESEFTELPDEFKISHWWEKIPLIPEKKFKPTSWIQDWSVVPNPNGFGATNYDIYRNVMTGKWNPFKRGDYSLSAKQLNPITHYIETGGKRTLFDKVKKSTFEAGMNQGLLTKLNVLDNKYVRLPDSRIVQIPNTRINAAGINKNGAITFYKPGGVMKMDDGSKIKDSDKKVTALESQNNNPGWGTGDKNLYRDINNLGKVFRAYKNFKDIRDLLNKPYTGLITAPQAESFTTASTVGQIARAQVAKLQQQAQKIANQTGDPRAAAIAQMKAADKESDLMMQAAIQADAHNNQQRKQVLENINSNEAKRINASNVNTAKIEQIDDENARNEAMYRQHVGTLTNAASDQSTKVFERKLNQRKEENASKAWESFVNNTQIGKEYNDALTNYHSILSDATRTDEEISSAKKRLIRATKARNTLQTQWINLYKTHNFDWNTKEYTPSGYNQELFDSDQFYYGTQSGTSPIYKNGGILNYYKKLMK